MTLDGNTPEDFTLARVLIVAAVALPSLIFFYWLVVTNAPFGLRLVVAMLMGTVLLVVLPQALRWIDNKEAFAHSEAISGPYRLSPERWSQFTGAAYVTDGASGVFITYNLSCDACMTFAYEVADRLRLAGWHIAAGGPGGEMGDTTRGVEVRAPIVSPAPAGALTLQRAFESAGLRAPIIKNERRDASDITHVFIGVEPD